MRLASALKRLQRILGEVRGLDVSSLHSENADPNGEDAIDPPADAEEDPFHQALRSEMTGLLDKALGELAARERDVLGLYHFEELTMKEVGAILGIGESRVSQIHSAALLRLRDAPAPADRKSAARACRAPCPTRRPGRPAKHRVSPALSVRRRGRGARKRR